MVSVTFANINALNCSSFPASISLIAGLSSGNTESTAIDVAALAAAGKGPAMTYVTPVVAAVLIKFLGSSALKPPNILHPPNERANVPANIFSIIYLFILF